MSFAELFARTESPRLGNCRQGIFVGLVTNNHDKEGLGRIKVKFPLFGDEHESHWARVATPMAGKDRGMFFLPEIGDEVLLVFDQGDMRIPYVIGALWNGKDTPPVLNKEGKNNIRIIKSRSGHVIRLNDEEGKETIEIIDKTKQNRITVDTSSNTITIATQKDIHLSAPQGTIKLEAQKLELQSSGQTVQEAGSTMDITSKATMSLKGTTVNIN